MMVVVAVVGAVAVCSLGGARAPEERIPGAPIAPKRYRTAPPPVESDSPSKIVHGKPLRLKGDFLFLPFAYTPPL